MKAKYVISTTYVRLVSSDPELARTLDKEFGDELETILGSEYVEGDLVERIYSIYQKQGLDSWTLRFAEKINLAAHGPLGFAVLTAANLREAMQTMADYAVIRASNLSSRFEEGPNESHLIMDDFKTSGFVKRWIAELVVYVDLKLLEAILTQSLSGDVKISFNHSRPEYADELDQFYGTTCHYNCDSTGISFPSAWCRMASPLADAETYQTNLMECRALKLDMVTDQANAAVSTQLALEAYFYNRRKGQNNSEFPPTLGDLARQQNCSSRTLARKLANANTSYKLLLETERRNHSKYLLKNTHLSVSDIAHTLAYGEPANFVRAFKKWFDTTPTAWRQQIHD